MAYRFRGVPKAFQTRDQALAFLRNSPGYVKRQSSYLQTYWPGLAAELGPAQAPTTVRAKQDAEIWSAPRSIFVPPAFTDAGGSGAGPVSPTGTTPTPAEVRRAALKQARDRRRFSLGLPITTPLAPNIADAVPTYRTPQQQRALDLLAHPPGTIVGEALRNWKKNVIRQSGLTPTEQQQMLHEVDQWYATPGANLVDVAKGIGKAAWHANDVVQRAAYGDPNAQEAVLNNTIGKGLTNLLQGQGPKNARDVAGLLLGAAMLPLPYGKAGKAAIGAARAASEVGGSWARTGEPFVREVVHVTTPEQASAIRASGFKVGVGEGFGRNPDYGQGVYLSDKESDMASYWRHQLATKNEEGIVPTDTVSGTVRLQNPYAYDYIRYDRVGAHISPRESLAAQRPDLLPRYDELVAQTGSTASGEKQAFGAVLREGGYDGIVINHRAGEEIVAFDPAAVKVDTRATNITPPGKVKPNDWGADDPRRVNRLDRIIWKQRPPAAPSPYDAERNALISALRESHGSRSKKMQGFMPYRDGGGITIVSNGSQTNATLPKWANSFANDIAAAADAAGINHVDFEAENLGLIIGEGAPSGDSQVLGSAGKLAGRTLDDQLAAEGRDALNAAVERVRAARGQGLGSEAGQLTPGAFAERAPAGSRTLTVNDLTQQVGSRARSRVTQAWIENPADRLSLAMMADNRLAAIARRIMPTASAEARVSRYAGRQQMIEASRSWGAMQRYERALPKEGSPEDIAHYWWAQLPPQMRDVSGLKAVRAKQAQNLEELTSGRALESLQRQERAVSTMLGAARYSAEGSPPGVQAGSVVHAADRGNWGKVESISGDTATVHFVSPEGGEARVQLPVSSLTSREDMAAKAAADVGGEVSTDVHKLLEELQSIKLDIADIPIKIEDLSTALARLDEVIANPPKLDSKVIEAVARFSEERQRILQEAGVLKAENAGPRRGLVANWLGVDPTGAEVYVGHRMGKTRGARASLLPGGVGTGRPTTPQGARSMNRLVLADTGRLRDSTRVAVDDWQAAQVYRSALQSRNDLGKLGRAFDGRLGPNEYLINPRGRPVPPQWKRDRLAEIADQGYDEEQIRQAAQDIVDTYMADPAHAQQMLADARDQGVQWNELRVIDAKTADRYFSHAGVKKPPRSGAIGTAYDTAVDAAVASIIFARIGYIPKNVVANLIMGVPHQGVYLFANVPRAMQVLTDADLLPRLAAEVGESGPTVALGNEAAIAKAKGIPSKIAHAVSNVADNPLRISAFLHEAAAEGVISKTSPILNATDRQALLDLLDDPAKRPLLNDIRARSVEAMADFSRMTPTQRKYARRFLVIPGWLWAGSRYPFHFVATHPGRSLAIGYVAAGEPGSPVQTNKPITDYMAQGVANFNAGFDLGGKKVLRTGAISPVSTPWEVAQAVAQRDGRTIGDYTNPFAASVWNVAHSQLDSPTGPYRTSFGKSVVGNTTRLVPGYSLGKNLISPPDKPRYFPEDTSRLGRLKREVGVIPIQVNKTASGTRPKAYQRVFKERQQVFDAAAKLYGITELPPALKHAYNVKARVEAARAVAEKEFPNGGVDYARAAYLEEAKVAVSLGLAKQSDLDHLRSALASASQADIEKWRRSLQQTLWEDAYLRPIREARAVLKEKGVELTHG